MAGYAVALCLGAGPAEAQILRNPPTPYGPAAYDLNFTDPAVAGLSSGLKDIPLGDMPGWYVNLGGSLRERFESFANAAFDFIRAGGTKNEDYLEHRLLLSGDFHFGPYVRTFVQLGQELETGRQPEPQPTDIDRGDLAQGFVELNLPVIAGATVNARAGRQEMTFGSNRLVGNREGPNIRLSFDGVRAWTTLGDVRVDAFWVRPVTDYAGWFNDTADPTQKFFGVYATTPVRAVPGLSVDLYYMGIDRNHAVLDAGVANERRQTVGTRLFGVARAFDYNFEGMYQFGNFGDRPISAFAVFSDSGYTIKSAWGTPRLALKADIASGGNSRGTGTLGTFFPMFPNYNYINQMNAQTPMNYMDIFPYVQIQPRRDLAFMAGADILWRESIQDSFYEPPGIPVAKGNANNKRYLGEILSFQVEYQVSPNLVVDADVTHFFTAGFLRAAGGKDINYAAAWATFSF